MVRRSLTWVPLLLLSLGVALSTVRANEERKHNDHGAQINQWIGQLGSSDYFVRQKAQDELAKLGFEAFDALTAATTHDDLEVAARARYLLRLIRVEWTVEGDSPDVKRLLRDYEAEPESERVMKIKALASVSDGMAALCRLVRFEQSPVLSKLAAVEILSHSPAAEPPGESLAQIIRAGLGSSHQTSAAWLWAFLRFRESPVEAMAQWNRLAQAERLLLQRSPAQTDGRIVALLLQFQVRWLEKLQRNEEAVAVIGQLIDLEKGDSEALATLLYELLEDKAWKLLDDVVLRFSSRFSRTPVLIYALAEAQSARGNQSRAEELAAQARQLNPGGDEESLLAHIEIAQRLWKRGLCDWSERELRGVISRGTDNPDRVALAQVTWSELLHEHDDDLRAAENLNEMLKSAKKRQAGEEEFGGRTLAEHRARMHFFFACHWQHKGDSAQYRTELDAALEADPTDVDVLIACYRLPHPGPQYRQKIRNLIQRKAAQLRDKIAESVGGPDEADDRNQFAWLIGNTEGDFDEALKHSQLSIERTPESRAGGLYDTLARVYYAKGDYENAVKYQTKASQLDPHCVPIRRQLELFRKALDARKTPNPLPPAGTVRAADRAKKN
jgi:tetratricopeptide (TPR) repeat protein